MNKVLASAHLDYVTVKPYLIIRYLVVNTLVALGFVGFYGCFATAIYFGMMVATLFLSYPFSIGEKNNMDALYVTLSAGRKKVVLGRYLFTFGLNLFAVLIIVVLTLLYQVVGGLLGMPALAGEQSWMMLSLAALLVIIQALMLPLYFKLGYMRTRLITMAKVIIVVLAYLLFMSHIYSPALVQILSGLQGMIVPLVCVTALVLALVVLASICLSQHFYDKREF
ncbi:MAG: ABC-2 transporter permease [Coriobacteriia bacterium]|nr:ABC-2 transporter permease [Coriobacteriia bacterium]